jgi:hypothetical protein
LGLLNGAGGGTALHEAHIGESGRNSCHVCCSVL